MVTQAIAAEWQATVDALETVVVLVDRSGMVSEANERAREMGALCGRSLAALPKPWPAVAALLRQVSSSRPALTAGCEEEGRVWEIAVRSILERDQSVVILEDVTNMVALAAQVRHNELLAEMGSLVGHMAHEVRNPLFSMSATVDALEARLGGEPRLAAYVGNLRREIRRLTALMEEVLEFGKPPVFDAAIQPLLGPIRDAIAIAEEKAAGRLVTIRLETVDEPWILIDRSRLAQAFQNVLDNALHFAPPGSTVTVRIVREGESLVHCLIEDRGPGFADAIVSFVFEPFFTTRSGGTGLGLSVVRRIVEMHGGRVSADNRKEGGACVTITLPLRNGSS